MPAIANRYAKALADVSLKLGQHERISRELMEFESLLSNHAELAHFYSNPAVPLPKKRVATSQIIEQIGLSQTIANFIFILIDKHRMGYFAEIRKAYQLELNARLGIAQAEIITAGEMDPETHQRLAGQLEDLTGKKVVLKFSQDPSLIGGVVTRIGDTIYDGSIRQQLTTLKTRLSSD